MRMNDWVSDRRLRCGLGLSDQRTAARSGKAEVGRAEAGRRDAVEGQRMGGVEGDQGAAAGGRHVGLYAREVADQAATQADRVLGRIEPGDLGVAEHPATEIEGLG